jgi:hypothetical protein
VDIETNESIYEAGTNEWGEPGSVIPRFYQNLDCKLASSVHLKEPSPRLPPPCPPLYLYHLGMYHITNFITLLSVDSCDPGLRALHVLDQLSEVRP